MNSSYYHPLKIGVIGLGAIGSELCTFIEHELPETHLEAVAEIDTNNLNVALKKVTRKPKVIDMVSLIAQCDLVIEAAHKDVVHEIAVHVLQNKKDLMVMSVGGILEHHELIEQFRKSHSKLYVPSGAIGGIDILKAAALGTIFEVTLTTTKGIEGLRGAPYVVHNDIELNVQEKMVIFRGNALEAVRGFPKNVNVAALLAIGGIGAERTIVEIAVDPYSTRNVHEIQLKGDFGSSTLRIENVPSPHNPKTSYLAVLSAKAMLKQLVDRVRIGT